MILREKSKTIKSKTKMDGKHKLL